VAAAADGATFVLRENGHCHYADENAISPLWKGQKFPMSVCISGWAMIHREAVAIEDIYQDSRIPHDAYRPTFVKSLVMVPIRKADPVGAIGNYWAKTRRATPEEMKLLQALADSTSIAMENVRLYADMEDRIRQRTAQLETANQELEAFSYAVSHDLRAPLRAIAGFSDALAEDCGEKLDQNGKHYLSRIGSAVRRMNELIEDLLNLSKVTRAPLNGRKVDLTAMTRELAARLGETSPGREVELVIADGIEAEGDPRLLRALLENLMNNAWKFTSKRAKARIEFSAARDDAGRLVYCLRDNGAGFNPEHAAKLFSPFQRLHSSEEFEGTGIGLATVQRIVARHGGKVWAEGKPGEGAAFFFTLE
ncbi:histidine kinase, partial [Candidatus Sumerlaeota bacterium]|nr:histidine kinase [Candidatus Sumerlaeota bacterium]